MLSNSGIPDKLKQAADELLRKTGKRVLILTPLAVARQIVAYSWVMVLVSLALWPLARVSYKFWFPS